jgi:hypothetical protein
VAGRKIGPAGNGFAGAAGAPTTGAGIGVEIGGAVVQAPSVSATARKDASKLARSNNLDFEVGDMWLLLLEAGVAMFLLVFIVWWTMFAGRKPEAPPRERSKRETTRAKPQNSSDPSA